MNRDPCPPESSSSRLLVIAVLLVALASLRFVYHVALFVLPLDTLMVGAWK
jgi:hypothetical protein